MAVVRQTPRPSICQLQRGIGTIRKDEKALDSRH